MGRLSIPKPKLTQVARRTTFAPDQAKGPPPTQHSRPWKAWYSTARWQRLRQEVLIRDAYTCQRTFRLCSGRPGEPDSPVVNHIRPHRGNEVLFWDPANLQTVTKQVHDSLIQAEEQDSRHTQGVWS